MRPHHALVCGLLFLINLSSNELKPANKKQKKKDGSISLADENTASFLKSLEQLPDNAINGEILDRIIKKSKLHESMAKSDSVFFFDSLLLNMASRANNLKYIAKGQSYMAYNYRTLNKQDSAYHYYNMAQKSYKGLNDSLQVGRKLLNMAKIQQRKAAYFESKETITEAMKYIDSVRHKTYWATALNELAHNFLDLKEFNMAEEFYKKAINKDDDSLNKILYGNNLAILYAETNKLEKAIDILQNLLIEIPKDFSREEEVRLKHNLATYEWKLYGKNPLSVFLESLQVRKEEKDSWGLLSSYSSLMDYYMSKEKDMSKAEKYSDSLISISWSLKNPNAEVETIAKFLKINAKKYANLAPRYVSLKDSIEESRQVYSNQFAFLKYQDEIEKQQLLKLENSSSQKEIELAQQRVQKVILLSLIMLLSLGGFSYYFVLRQRHQKEKLQEIYKTERRISADLHDNLAADMFGTLLMAQNKHIDDSLVKKLESLYQQTRRLSHENDTIVTGDDFKTELKDLFSDFKSNDIKLIIAGLNDINWSTIQEETCIVLHRSIKEILVNLNKHAMASKAIFGFKSDEKFIIMNYSDNGIGISTHTKKGAGFKHIAERVKNCRGTFAIHNQPINGLALRLCLPKT